MMQQLRAYTERANASAPRVADFASATLGCADPGTAVASGSTTLSGVASLSGFAPLTGFTTNAWNAMPVHTTAICTNGKRYERRLQEMHT